MQQEAGFGVGRRPAATALACLCTPPPCAARARGIFVMRQLIAIHTAGAAE